MKKRSVLVGAGRIGPSKDYNKSNNRNLQNRKYHHRHPENSNITGIAKRLTLQPGFVYHHATKSESNHQKHSNNYSSEAGEETEDFFIKPEVQLLRRSCRLSSKKCPILVTSASSYYQYITSSSPKSKSIFKEINDKFKTRNNGALLADFGRRLQLQSNQPKPRKFYQDQVAREIRIINEMMSSSASNNGFKHQQQDKSVKLQEMDEMNKENIPLKFLHVPKCNWVFQTPPNRKLKTASEMNRIQPAVLDANKVIYEMKNRVNIDLTGFSNKQEVDIDRRYMMEVSDSHTSPFQDTGADELESHFLSLTCRPKKTTTVQSKVASARIPLKRKRDIFEPNFEESLDEFDANFTSISNENHLGEAEESFTFQFTTESDANNGNCNKKAMTTTTTGHFFDFAGNKKDSFHFQF